MRRALRELLTGVIDYAGLFPPAQLSLDAAIRIYAADRLSPDAWMLSRFICPTLKLADLAAYDASLFQNAPPFRISALGRGGDTAAAFLPGLEADLAEMRTFEQAAPGRARVDGFETRIPADLVRDDCTGELVRTLDAARDLFAAAGFGHVPLACEAPLGGDRRRRNETLAGAISFHNSRRILEGRGTNNDNIALKLRCGGTSADAFPTVDEVGFVLAVALQMGVPLKFTAGLHHPIRRFDEHVGAYMHGFINVFAAGVLATVHDWDAPEVTAVLVDESAASFVFSDAGLAWRGHAADVEQIRAARERLVLGFGSCSFDEPREDLRRLGWMHGSP